MRVRSWLPRPCVHPSDMLESLACTVWDMRWCRAVVYCRARTRDPPHAHAALPHSLGAAPVHACAAAPRSGGREVVGERAAPPFSTPGSHPGAPRGKPRRALRPSPHARTAQLPCRELLMRPGGSHPYARVRPSKVRSAWCPWCPAPRMLERLVDPPANPPCPPRRRSTEWNAPSGAVEPMPPFRRTGRAPQPRSPTITHKLYV